jgi:hypothetical protein
MCRIIVENNKDTEFILYNIVFGNINNITVDNIVIKLKDNDIDIDKSIVKRVLDKWTRKGLLFNNHSNYIRCPNT